jgi:hypothetical protein
VLEEFLKEADMFGFKSGADKRAERRREGYDFAAGVLLRKQSTLDSLRVYADAMDFKTSFDYGVEEATRDWESLNRKG